jgi:hypothetical protein
VRGNYKIDLTAMLVFHDALRRDLEQLARVAARTTGDPRDILRTSVGWTDFKTYLHVHHTSEDEMLWPMLREALTDRPDELLLLATMESEHAALDPVLKAVDAELSAPDGGSEQIGDLVDALTIVLGDHLRHEEAETLPLIADTLTQEQFLAFGASHPQKIGPGVPHYLPWLLTKATDEDTTNVMALMPENARQLYYDAWQPAYAAQAPWGPPSEDS